MKKQYRFSFLGRRKYARDMEIYHMSPRYEAHTTDGKTVYSGTFNPDSNSIEQAIINDNL